MLAVGARRGEGRTLPRWCDVRRYACRKCGAPVYSTYGRTDEFYLHPGLFDDIGVFAPTYELWAIRREPWLPAFPSVVHRYEKGRPDGAAAKASASPLTAPDPGSMVRPGNTP